jgi:glycopeptide antibiotics resistance protein
MKVFFLLFSKSITLADMMKHTTSKYIFWIAFVAYMLLLVKFILLKQPHYFLSQAKHFGIHNIQAGEKKMVLIPFKTTLIYLRGKKGFWAAIANLGGNIIGFVPMGILLPLLFKKLSTGVKVVLTIFLISLAFEITQFIVGVGYADVDDIIQNTLGGAFGYWLYCKYFSPLLHAPATS